jgi:hypothetical protein
MFREPIYIRPCTYLQHVTNLYIGLGNVAASGDTNIPTHGYIWSYSMYILYKYQRYDVMMSMWQGEQLSVKGSK